MEKTSYQVVLTGELVSGFTREAVLAALARLFQVSAAKLVPMFDGGEYLIDDALSADEASALQKRLERVGARARVERVVAGLPGYPRIALNLPKFDDPAEAGLMRCPACGHEQLVARQCDECGVVFAEYNRQRGAGHSTAVRGSQRPGPVPSAVRAASAPRQAKTAARHPSDIHASANAMWREDWLDDGHELPTEQYHVNLFMGGRSTHLSEACQKMMLGRRTRLMLTWAGGAVISPFLWAMYRKMWAWGVIIFVAEILIPVALITLGTREGVSDKLILVGIAVMILNRLFWPALLKSLYCRHARRTILYMNRLAPTYASDIDIATRGGTSRTSVFVGIVLAIVVSLLAWSIVDSLHERWYVQAVAYVAPATLPPAPPAPGQQATEQAVDSQNELLVNENKWVATRNKLRVLGQRVSAWLADGRYGGDPARLDMNSLGQMIGLDAQSRLDGWEREIRYQSDGKGYQLISAGPDGQFGTPDDVEYRRILER